MDLELIMLLVILITTYRIHVKKYMEEHLNFIIYNMEMRMIVRIS